MNYDSYGQSMPHPSRRSIRLKGYDYVQPETYFCHYLYVWLHLDFLCCYSRCQTIHVA